MTESNLRWATVADTNIYVLPTADGYVLVDTTDESKYAELEEALRQLGVGFSVFSA